MGVSPMYFLAQKMSETRMSQRRVSVLSVVQIPVTSTLNGIIMKLIQKLFHPRPASTPTTGEATRQQGVAQAGIGLGQVPGFLPPQSGTYGVYRRMSGHPTLALAKSIVTAPILAGSWSFEARRPDGKRPRRNPPGDGVRSDPIDRLLEDRCRFIQRQIEPMRTAFLVEALRALEFGWRPFEKVWEVNNGQVILTRLKPLLPDFTYLQVDAHGNFAGIVQMEVRLPVDKAFIYTYDGEAGNLYGRSRHENARQAWSCWQQVDDRTAQLATKVSAIIPLVHYPIGQSRDANGQQRDNGDLADVILNGLGSGRGVKLPNLFASTEDPRLSAELAGKSSWMVSFLEAANAAHNLTGLTERQRYYDALMFRAWLRPERVGLESKHGSRADASKHTETGLTDSELLHADICDQLNRGVVDEILTYNFGVDSAGSVYVSPSPLQETKRALLQKLLEAVWGNTSTLKQFLAQTDMDAVFDVLEIPRGNQPVAFQ